MFEVSSETGWFEFSGTDVPEEVMEHLQNREDVVLFEREGCDVKFYSQNETLPRELYDEDGVDGFKDYGAMSSAPVDLPTNLPEELTESVSVKDYFNDEEIVELVQAVGVTGDPRNYIHQNRLRLRPSDALTSESVNRANPLPWDVLQDYKERVVPNERTNYPTLTEIKTVRDELHERFGCESVSIHVIGFYKISPAELQIHIDGVAISSVDEETRTSVLQWCESNLNGQRSDLFYANEIHRSNDWIRLWCD